MFRISSTTLCIGGELPPKGGFFVNEIIPGFPGIMNQLIALIVFIDF